MPNRNQQVADDLDVFSAWFEEGAWGRLELALDKPPSRVDMAILAAQTDNIAWHLKGWQADGNTVSITFQKGPLFLALIPLALGALGIGVLGWRLFSVPSQGILDTVKAILIPLGVMALGAGIVYVGRRSMPMMLTGLGIVGVGGFLAYRMVKPSAKEGLTSQETPTLDIVGE